MKEYVYFETRPKGGYLDDSCYEACSLTVGRPCLDVALLLRKKLILVRRSVSPGKGLWMAGGRIKWNLFKNIPQYASLTLKEHFGIKVPLNTMTVLNPRFICLKERPYPEVLIWVMVDITQTQFNKITLSETESEEMLIFEKKSELNSFIAQNRIRKHHASLFLDLWDELVERKLVR